MPAPLKIAAPPEYLRRLTTLVFFDVLRTWLLVGSAQTAAPKARSEPPGKFLGSGVSSVWLGLAIARHEALPAL